MSQWPPFSVSVRAADYMAKIVESITRLDFGTDFRLDIRLHRENRVRSIYSSLAIEGNLLSLDEVAEVIDGHPVRGRPRDIQEVKNAHATYDRLLTLDPYDVGDFLEAHRMLTEGLIEESGRFRGGDVAVFDGDTPVHVGARPQFVPGLVSELFSWARESGLQPVLLSAVVHCEIETIHPFADGNGRIGRLWQTIILARWNRVFASLPMESAVFGHRPDYYLALRSSQRVNDATEFIEFSLGTILNVIEDALVTSSEPASGTDDVTPADVGRNVGRNVGRKLPESILAALREDPVLTGAELSELVGVTPRTVDRHLRALKDAGRLRREGSRKAGRWIVIEAEETS